MTKYIYDELGIDRDSGVVKEVRWSRLSGLNSGVHLESDTSSAGIQEWANVDSPDGIDIAKQIVLAGDRHKTMLDIEP